MALAWPFVALVAIGVAAWMFERSHVAKRERAAAVSDLAAMGRDIIRFNERAQKLEDDLRNLSQRVSPAR